MFEKKTFNKKIILLINLLLLQALVVAINVMITWGILAKYVQIPMVYISRVAQFVGGFTAVGSIVLLVEIFRLAEKEREADLNALRLEESRQMLDVLLAHRHDFMNHIQAIYSMAQMGLQENLASYVDKLIDGIETDSKLNKSAPLELTAFLIKKRGYATSRGVKFDIEVEADLKGLMIPPPEMVRVIGNLVDNALYALKQGKQPEKRILVKLAEERDQHIILVCDNGPGIPDDIKKQVFEKGFSTKGADGSGLGLYITKGLVEKYGGGIGLTALPGFNTCFTIKLPKEPQLIIETQKILTVPDRRCS